MALASNITINNAANVARSFNTTSVEPNGTIRKEVSSSVMEPERMIVRHSVQKRGKTTVDRHVVNFSKERTDALGETQKTEVNVAFVRPRSSVSTRADADDLFAYMRNWFAVSANVTALDNGES